MTSPTTSARTVTLVDLKIQNILSVENAFRVVGAQVRVASHADEIAQADLLVLPGVGSFASASERLHQSGMANAIRAHALQHQRPVVGLCLGMQLLADSSEEHGHHPGLGLIPGKVVRLQEVPPEYRVPNIGWRQVEIDDSPDSPLPNSLNGSSFYHVHSFEFKVDDAAHQVGSSFFGHSRIASIVRRGAIIGTQFHPEKSQEAGLDLLHSLVCNLHQHRSAT